MRLLILTLALASSACRIAPIIQDPVISGVGDRNSGRYEDCRTAARDYCKDVEGASGEALKRCVSKATYTCVSGGER
jgi:hypothetical protein